MSTRTKKQFSTESVESKFVKSKMASMTLAKMNETHSDGAKTARLNLSVEVPLGEVEKIATALEGALLISEGLFISSDRKKPGRYLAKSAYSVSFEGREHKLLKSHGIISISPQALPSNDTAAKKTSSRPVNEYGEELYSADEVFPEATPGMTLKGFRLRDEMTQGDLASRLNIPQSRVSALETGKRQISKEMAKQLGAIFEIPYKAFL